MEIVKTISEYLDRVRDLRKHWQLKDHQELSFRGEAEKYATPLRPNLYRPATDRLLKPILDLLAIEKVLHEKFMGNGGQLTNEKPGSDDERWDWYFLMQHHSAPNRLLDWSEGALIALHFAIRHINEVDATFEADENPRVYVLEPKRMSEMLNAHPATYVAQEKWKKYFQDHDDLKYDGTTDEFWERAYLPDTEREIEELPVPLVPMILNFDRISRRVAAQRSQFMVFGTDPNWLFEVFKEDNSPVREIVIDRSQAYKMKVELKDCGVTESLVYPDLDGLGREMNILFKDRIST